MTSRALVVGGGGVTGVAWELGMLAGLAEAGIDLLAADLIVGTSAGAVVGAQLASGRPLEELFEAQLADPGSEVAARMGRAALLRFGWAIIRSRDPLKVRTRIGRLALAARVESEAERRAVLEARLPLRDWPERRLLITAVDAATGEFRVFDRESGVPLLDAVGASCAVPGVWPPVTIDGRRYVDGGIRSATNADLAAGYDRVVIVAPIADGYGPIPGVARHAAELRQSAQVAVVSPDAAARAAIGRKVLDPARRAPAARAGRAQAAAMAGVVAEVWTS